MGQRAVTEVQREKLLSEFEENCQKAATAIKEADYFLFATGAGFSADSGLAGSNKTGQWSNNFQCTKTLQMWKHTENVL